MVFDRAGRSEGTAYVTYGHVADARQAIKEFDGANAKGQPIRLSLIPLPRRDNPFDRVENPKSLFDRVEAPRARRRSQSPMDDVEDDRGYRRAPRRAPDSARDRRSDTTKPAPENIDRYIPGQGGSRSSSHRGGRRPGERRERAPRGGRDAGGHQMIGGRPRKTQEELDAEMDDYWTSTAGATENSNGAATNPAATGGAAAANNDDDIDMIE
jgi:THO complex subunit 4